MPHSIWIVSRDMGGVLLIHNLKSAAVSLLKESHKIPSLDKHGGFLMVERRYFLQSVMGALGTAATGESALAQQENKRDSVDSNLLKTA